MPLQCETLVVHCMDYRLQAYLNQWMEETLPARSYDRVALAGGVYDIYNVISQVDIAVRLHEIQKVVFINHENCGAYGSEGNNERHEFDLRMAREKVNMLFPHLNVDLFYLNLDGSFERID